MHEQQVPWSSIFTFVLVWCLLLCVRALESMHDKMSHQALKVSAWTPKGRVGNSGANGGQQRRSAWELGGFAAKSHEERSLWSLTKRGGEGAGLDFLTLIIKLEERKEREGSEQERETQERLQKENFFYPLEESRKPPPSHYLKHHQSHVQAFNPLFTDMQQRSLPERGPRSTTLFARTEFLSAQAPTWFIQTLFLHAYPPCTCLCLLEDQPPCTCLCLLEDQPLALFSF